MSNAPAPQAAEQEPEIPTEVAHRKPVALTYYAAEDKRAFIREGTTDAGQSGKLPEKLAALNKQRAASSKAAKAKETAQKFIFTQYQGEPQRGLKAADVHAIMARQYAGAPAMEAVLGDMTPAFVNWLWANHPEDAAVRYHSRDVWPTDLPTEKKPVKRRARKTSPSSTATVTA